MYTMCIQDSWVQFSEGNSDPELTLQKDFLEAAPNADVTLEAALCRLFSYS